jgi:hypothetical protein
MLQVTVWQVCGRLHGGPTAKMDGVFAAVHDSAFGLSDNCGGASFCPLLE